MPVQIRGIASTSLTKILLEEAFPVSSPSPVIAKRFGDMFSPETPTSFIRSFGDRILIEGNNKEIDMICKILKRHLLYSCFLKKWISPPIYKAKVIERTPTGYEVKIGENLVAHMFSTNKEFAEGEGVLGIVLGKENRIFRPTPYISGRYITINIGKEEIRISKHIANKETISKLVSMLDVKGMGIYFKKSAEGARMSDLMEEINRISRLAEEVIKKSKEIDSGMLFPGFYSYEIVLSLPDFTKLDEIRADVVKTIEMHHLLKSLGKDASFLVDVIEASDVDPKIGSKIYSGFLKYKRSLGTDLHGIIHRKITGDHLILRGYTRKISEEEIIFVRIMRGGGKYDGLEVEKESGDYAVTRIFPGKWWIYHSYYDSQGKYKGSYFNVNTPPEVLPEFVRYTDLEVDVVLWPDGEMKVIDEDLLDEAVKEGIITEELKRRAMIAVEEIKKYIEERRDEIIKDESA